jgi:Family of unknown function (DUF6077)
MAGESCAFRWEAAAVRLLDGSVVLFGVWTLWCWTVQALGASFHTLVLLAWVPLLAAAAALRWLPAPDPACSGAAAAMGVVAKPEAEALQPRALVVAAAVAGLVMVVAVAAGKGAYPVYWVLAVGVLVAAGLRARRDAPDPAAAADGARAPAAAPPAVPALPAPLTSAAPCHKGGGAALVALFALCVLAAGVTLAAHRPDADDSFYLNLVVTALDRPAEPLLAYDGLYGERGLPPFETWYRLKSYEPLVATLSRLGGVDPKALYYLVFPALFAVLCVLAHWSALRCLGGRPGAVAGAAAVVLALLAWGDVHQAFGNFAFVRLFQGKAVAVVVAVPAALSYAAGFCRAPGARTWMLLALVQAAAVGISGSAVVAVPITALLLVAAWSAAERRPALLLWGGAAALPIAGFAAATVARMPLAQRLAISWADVTQLPALSTLGLSAVLGTGPRARFALFALLLAPLLAAPGRRRRCAIAYVLALLLAVMNPWTPALAGRFVQRFLWRIFWAVPFPLLIGLCAQRLATLRRRRGAAPPAAPEPRAAWPRSPRSPGWPDWLPGAAAAAGFSVIFACLPGTWTLSPHDGTRLGLPALKVPPEHELAATLIALSRPTDLVLAPYDLAEWVTTFRRHPRLIGVRPDYYGAVAGEGPRGIDERRRLEALVGGPATSQPPPPLAGDLALVAGRGVDLVAVDTSLPWAAPLASGLAAMCCAAAAPPLLGERYALYRCTRPRTAC